MRRRARVSVENEYAVVFSGGGAFGAWEVGAYDEILSRHHGHPPTIVTGASAGALNAAAICAGVSPADLQKLWTGLTPDKVYRSQVRVRDFLKAVIRQRSISQ